MAKKKTTALAKSTKKLTSKGPIPKEGKPEFQASFALTFEVTQDQKFTVSMADIADIIDMGLYLKLPEEVSLGKFQEFYDWLNNKFFDNGLPDIKNVPVVSQFMNGDIKIMTFEVKTPGKTNKSQKYVIDVKIQFDPAIPTVGSLKLEEVEFGAKYEKNQ